jgi:hypothetical protein
MQASRISSIPSHAIPNTRKPRVSCSRVGLGSIDPDAIADRRRRAWRELSKAISTRLEPLHPADAALLRAIFEQGMTITQVCDAAHAHNGAPGKSTDLEPLKRRLRYRVRQLVARVLSPGYVFIQQHEHQIPPELQPIARLCVLQGCRQRDVSQQLNLSLNETRRRLIAVHALIDAARRARAVSDSAPAHPVTPLAPSSPVPTTH